MSVTRSRSYKLLDELKRLNGTVAKTAALTVARGVAGLATSRLLARKRRTPAQARAASRRGRFPALHRSDAAGAFAAAASVASTFQRTLIPRSTSDQAIITGGTMTLTYLAASLAHDVLETSMSLMVFSGRKKAIDDDLVRRIALTGDAFGVVSGLFLQRLSLQEHNEPIRNAALRTLGFFLASGSAAGLASGLTEEAQRAINARFGREPTIGRLPVAVFGGVCLAVGVNLWRRRREAAAGVDFSVPDVVGPRAIGLGAGIGVGLLVLIQGSQFMSRMLGRVLVKALPGDEKVWRPMSALISLSALGALGYALWYRTTTRIEESTSKIEAAFDTPPRSSLVSGGPGSHVTFESMGREGRRHARTVLPVSVIEKIMGEPAKDPIRVFVGLDSAPSREERIRLAIYEMERTGAFDRGLIIVASPTGTGYVNYVAIESAEYFTRGDCATVTVQYSKRPSPVSLDRVWLGRKQFRMLLAAIRRKLYKMAPEERPKLVVFGESLGAHTSQDAFLDAGTQGLQDAGVDRALWLGTPGISKWKQQVWRGDRLDVEDSCIGEFDNFGAIESLDAEARGGLRYFLLTHGNDGVGHFAPELLIQSPDWLRDPDSRPPGVPKSQKWITPTTFIQTLIDMKNAMAPTSPGEFEANGHDYRADLARFVREAYGLGCSDEQMEEVEAALRRYEMLRQGWLEVHPGLVEAESDAQPEAG
ncbi:MAG: alpha/beta-hydrolase family protein [Chloroflexi bacterium]|nr:alpha/beta-hydrolase family protein [Chloroflexota bacterium]MCI0883500.1 alpha/beta-hydrolase family protein [Chloroflexota bacterium]